MKLQPRSTPGEAAAVRRAATDEELARVLRDMTSTPAEIRSAIDLHSQLASFTRAARRQASLRWISVLAGIAIVAAAALSLVRLGDLSVVLTASTSAFFYGVGPDDEILVDSTSVSRISFQGEGGTLSFCSDSAAAQGCTPSAALRLRSLAANAGGEISLRRRSGCNEITFLSGGGLLEVDTGSRDSDPKIARVRSQETVRYCGAERATVILRRPRYLILGDATAETLSERILLPAASNATLLYSDIDRIRHLRSTEILQVEGLRDAIASIQMGDSMELTLAGRARSIGIVRTQSMENVNPTWLDLALGSPQLRGWLSLVAALWTGLILFRNRIEEIFF